MFKRPFLFFVLTLSLLGQVVSGPSGGGVGVGAANPTATSVPSVTSLAIPISTLSLPDLTTLMVQCWSGTSAPYTPVTITTLNPASVSSVTANFASTANITCRANSNGGAGAPGSPGTPGSAGPAVAGTGLVKVNAGAAALATAGTDYVAPGDFRLTDARNPMAHAATHATGQPDVISPALIGALPAVAGTGVVGVTAGVPGLIAGTASNCVLVSGGSGPCGGGSMVYPGAGVPISTSSAWGTSVALPANPLLFLNGNGAFTAPPGGSGAPAPCRFFIGADNAGPLVDSDMGPQTKMCRVNAAATIAEIVMGADAGTPTVQLQKRHCSTFVAGICSAWTLTPIMSAALAAPAGGFDGCAKSTISQACIDGTTSSGTITIASTAVAAGDYLELLSGVAGGVAKKVSVTVVLQ